MKKIIISSKGLRKFLKRAVNSYEGELKNDVEFKFHVLNETLFYNEIWQCVYGEDCAFELTFEQVKRTIKVLKYLQEQPIVISIESFGRLNINQFVL